MADAHAAHYNVAGQMLVCQNTMQGLAAFTAGLAAGQPTDFLSEFAEPTVMTATNSELRYAGKAYFEKQFREVRFWRTGKCGQLDVDGVPACQIDFAEAHIHVLNDEPLGVGLNLELITGPALVLLLTLHQTYCMHAGAVDTSVGRIGIIAESGAGKSTLSAHEGDRWSQVTDDIMPVTVNDVSATVDVLPDFPQLKLTNHLVADGPNSKKPLDYLLRVNPAPSDNISFEILPPKQAMLQVIRHTVAAKLFDSSVLQQHANFAKKVSALVPVIEVSYPRDLDQLDNLRDAIVEYLGGL